MSPGAVDLEPHRPALRGHCYRMLGSAVDADDAVQDTLVRALRGLDRFAGRSSLRTWLVRIATNVCLDELQRRERRVRPMEAPPGTPEGPFGFEPAEKWIEPIPDDWVVPSGADPATVLAARQDIRLAFVAALQHLPPLQRAALLLTQVVGMSAREAAEALDTSVASVNSAAQRARATVSALDRGAVAPADPATVERYAAAFEAYDVERIVALLADDVTFCMPPIPLWLRGPAHVATFLAGPGAECEGSVLVPVRASGAPAFAQYRHGGRTPWGLVVLGVEGDRITAIDTFLDVGALFPMFGLPSRVSSDGRTFSTPTDDSAVAPRSNG